jgi:hypothetical protein
MATPPKFSRAAWVHTINDPNTTPARWQSWREHFQQRPFDIIWYGLLHIQPKAGGCIQFVPNSVQTKVVKAIEEEWYARRPVKTVTLKARQMGLSTVSMAILFCLMWAYPDTNAHLITHLQYACDNLREMLKLFYKRFPKELKPKLGKDNRKVFEMKFLGEDGDESKSVMLVETAEHGEGITRSGCFQFSNFSELAFWKDSATLVADIEPSIPPAWPSLAMEESTGKASGDPFSNTYFAAKNGTLLGWKAFFFRWFELDDYVMPLPKDMAVEDFLRGMSEEDREMMNTYNLSVEQINWYAETRLTWMIKTGGTADQFRQEYPTVEEDAFFGGGSNVFDPDMVNRDRIRIEGFRKTQLSQLPVSCSLTGPSPPGLYARCALITDEPGEYRSPLFVDANMGDWTVWERPRYEHEYIVTADPAEGREAMKGLKNTADFSVIDVWRVSCTVGEEHIRFVQVAQFRRQVIDPRDLAKQARAAASYYRADLLGQQQAVVIVEANNQGGAFIDEGKANGMEFFWTMVLGEHGERMERQIGFRTSTGLRAETSKAVALTQFKAAWMQGLAQVNSRATNAEMAVYVRENGKYGATRPHHDDTITAAFLFLVCHKGRTNDVVPRQIRSVTPEIQESDMDVPPPPKLDKWAGRGTRWQNLEVNTKCPA